MATRTHGVISGSATGNGSGVDISGDSTPDQHPPWAVPSADGSGVNISGNPDRVMPAALSRAMHLR
ncbi:hypothetical protein O5169_27835 [Escherichia coli]|nr:hypothetical protein [Escherichia coli]